MATRTVSKEGGSRKWSETTTWAEAAVPKPEDNVVDAVESGEDIVEATSECRSLVLEHCKLTQKNFTLKIGDGTAGAGGVALKFGAGMTYTQNGFISFVSTNAAAQTVDFGGHAAPIVTFAGVGGSWKLESNLSCGELNLKFGTLDLNGKTCVWGNFNSSENATRVLRAEGATISLGGVSGEVWKLANAAKLTLLAAGSTIKVTSSSSNARVFVGEGLSYGTLAVEGTAGSTRIAGSNTFEHLTLVAKAKLLLTHAATQTLTNAPEWKGKAGETITVESDSAEKAELNLEGKTAVCDYLKLKNVKVKNGTFYAGSHSTDEGGNEGILFEDPPKGEAPTVVTGTPVVSDTSATIHGEVNPGGLATTVKVEYGPTSGYGSEVPVGSIGEGKALKAIEALLEELDRSTAYHYRIVATNSSGTTNGEDQTFSTACGMQWNVGGKLVHTSLEIE